MEIKSMRSMKDYIAMIIHMIMSKSKKKKINQKKKKMY